VYDITWARSVVSDWWKLCTRTQILKTHYEVLLALYYPNLALRADESLFQDLVILLARSKGEADARGLWAWYKRIAGHMGTPISALDESKMSLGYARMRLIAHRGIKEWFQPDMFSGTKLT